MSKLNYSFRQLKITHIVLVVLVVLANLVLLLLSSQIPTTEHFMICAKGFWKGEF